MAPELAFDALEQLAPGSLVLDPMAGSGTVLRHASELGLRGIGFDMDPLAVLMSRVWNTHVADRVIRVVGEEVFELARAAKASDIDLPWIDRCEETRAFVKYWFGFKQRRDLRRIAHAICVLSNRYRSAERRAALDVVRIALSRIIITKDRGASLARDVSHSRPHKVEETSPYDVLRGLAKSLLQVRQRLEAHPPWSSAHVSLGDARNIHEVESGTVDAVLTSPPYLNAIDYMRGHRLSLVWLGYSVGHLRVVRSGEVGAERRQDQDIDECTKLVVRAMVGGSEVAQPFAGMIARYAQDVIGLLGEVARVLKCGGVATYVVGNSCLRESFIRNSDGVAAAATLQGLQLLRTSERELPERQRYLPVTSGSLEKRMRTETILDFAHV